MARRRRHSRHHRLVPGRRLSNWFRRGKWTCVGSAFKHVVTVTLLLKESDARTHRTPKALRANPSKRLHDFAELLECVRVLASLSASIPHPYQKQSLSGSGKTSCADVS